MKSEQRKSERFADIGRAEAPELCIFPGVLEDISLVGCKIRFPVVVDIDMDSDVDLRIIPSHKSKQNQMMLIGQPQWVKQDSDATIVGFKFLHSPDTSVLSSYINLLQQDSNSSNFEEDYFALCCAM